MVKGESVGDLFISLGLDISEMEAAYIDADKSVRENQQKLQQQLKQNSLKLKMDSDLSGTDEVARKIKIVSENIRLQQDNVKLAEAEYKNLADTVGESSTQAQRAYNRLLKAQQAVSQSVADMSRLESEAIRTKVDTLNREMALIRAKSELMRSDTALSATEKEVKALEQENKLLDLQRQKVSQLQQAYKAQADKHGASSASATILQTEFLREAAILNNMQTKQKADMAMKKAESEAAMKSLSTQYAELIKSTFAGALISPVLSNLSNTTVLQPILNKLDTSVITNKVAQIRKAIEDSFANIKMPAAFAQISDAISAMTSKLKGVASPVGTLAGDLLGLSLRAAGVVGVLTGITAAIVKLGEKAAKTGDAVVSLSGRLHTTVKEAGALKKAMSFVGVDVEDAVNNLIRLDKSVMSGKENDVTKLLNAFDVKLKTESGALKTHKEQLDEIAKGYNQAKKMGLDDEYMTGLFGSKGKALYDYFDEYDKVNQMASQVKGAGLLDPMVAHELAMEYNQLNAQMSQFGSVFSQMFTLMAAPMVQPLTQLFRDMMTWITENKAGIKVLTEAFGELGTKVIWVADQILNTSNTLPRLLSSTTHALTENLLPAFNECGAAAAKMWAKATLDGDAYEQKIKEIEAELANDNKWVHDLLYGGDEKKPDPINYDEQIQKLKEIQDGEESRKRAVDATAEAEAIEFELAHTALETEIHLIEVACEKQRKLAAGHADEIAAINRLEAAQKARVAAREQKKAQEEAEASHKKAMENMSQADSIYFRQSHNEWQSQINDINKTAEAQAKMAKTGEETGSVWALAAAKVSDVWTKLVDKIKDLNRSLEDKIYAMTHSEAETRQHELMKEIMEYGKQGADPALLQRYYDLKSKEIGGNTGYKQIDLSPQAGDIVAKAMQQVEMNRAEAGGYGYSNGGAKVIDLNVNISGLEDVSNEVAQTAAKKIIEQMPSDNRYNYSYA